MGIIAAVVVNCKSKEVVSIVKYFLSFSSDGHYLEVALLSLFVPYHPFAGYKKCSQEKFRALPLDFENPNVLPAATI